MDKKYKYSEIFGHTIQGEGRYSGIPTVWLRFFGCNFECNGFGQDNPLDPSTYVLPYQTISLDSIKRMEDLPVFSTGCDSSYSWSKKYYHLAPTATVSEICDQLENYLRSKSNLEGKFLHPKSRQWTHMAFTGGEPMMNQNAIVDVMLEFARRGNMPKYVTVETNGTQKARDKFSDYIRGHDSEENYYREDFDLTKSFYMHGLTWLKAENLISLSLEEQAIRGIEWFWSVSPKLSISGEKWKDAIKPEIVADYYKLSPYGQLKFVCDGSDACWKEVEKATQEFRDAGVDWPVWIMPVGADVEGQNKVAAKVTEGAVERGYNVAARVHTFVFGNVVGK